ncbi:transcriptional regulator [Aliidongia dinghuensis]|uniref:Transcriptional regulator n=1 Tax=Aliidongia dinghuensis TaxID=1867774 RepID=A0A8J2Z0H8_9PROT|nr:AraC family transcriptional regulator [Aliidongia dinghuensis]GGF42131.1 transcriptional regulator [Aliidongia dinghuensis]
MVDPLAEVVTLLQPGARFSKAIVGAGPWHVRRSDAGQPFYCVVLEGGCRLMVDGHDAIELRSGDFILISAAYGVAMSSLAPPAAEAPETLPVALGTGEFRIGDQDGPTDLRMLVGHCSFGSPDAGLLVSLLPQLVHVRGEPRLATLVQLVRDEFRERRPAREVILAHLIEVLLIEALRSTAGTAASPGLVRGLADERLAVALRRMHESPTKPWTVAQMAKEAALSRSAFFERFSRAVGVAPMAYLLAWRMALAKNMLRQNDSGVAEIAERVGYGSASAFSVAFTRHVGLPPARYAREQTEPATLAASTRRGSDTGRPEQ